MAAEGGFGIGGGTAAGLDYRRLFAASPTPLLVLAPDAPRFTIKEANDAYLAATMRTRDALIGRGMFEAFPDNPDDTGATGVANLRASLERALATKRPDAMRVQRYDIPCPEGGFEERWWAPVNTPVLDETGEASGTIHHVTDVTGRWRAEKALRESEARWRDVFDRMGEGFEIDEMILGPDGRAVDFRYVDVNAAWERQSGFPRGMVVGRRAIEVFPAEETAFWVPFFGRVAETGEPAHIERFFAPAQRWLEVIAYRLGTGRVAVLLRDVTARHVAEDALRQSEERLRLIVEGTRYYAILTADPEGRIDTWLPGAACVFGWRSEEALGQPAAITFTPEDRENGVPQRELETARREGRAPDVRWHLRKDGARVFIEGTTTTLQRSDGRILGFLKIGQDVTARKAVEDRQALLSREVDHRAKNALAVVRAALRLTRAPDVPSYIRAIEGRVAALARAQTLLADDRWAGASLVTLLRGELPRS